MACCSCSTFCFIGMVFIFVKIICLILRYCDVLSCSWYAKLQLQQHYSLSLHRTRLLLTIQVYWNYFIPCFCQYSSINAVLTGALSMMQLQGFQIWSFRVFNCELLSKLSCVEPYRVTENIWHFQRTFQYISCHFCSWKYVFKTYCVIYVIVVCTLFWIAWTYFMYGRGITTSCLQFAHRR